MSMAILQNKYNYVQKNKKKAKTEVRLHSAPHCGSILSLYCSTSAFLIGSHNAPYISHCNKVRIHQSIEIGYGIELNI